MTDIKRPWGEVRCNDDGRVDEVVAKCRHFHLEQMNTNAWWIGVVLPNGETLHVDIMADKGLRIVVREDWSGGQDRLGGVKRR